MQQFHFYILALKTLETLSSRVCNWMCLCVLVLCKSFMKLEGLLKMLTRLSKLLKYNTNICNSLVLPFVHPLLRLTMPQLQHEKKENHIQQHRYYL